jgi:hypothetical protein
MVKVAENIGSKFVYLKRKLVGKPISASASLPIDSLVKHPTKTLDLGSALFVDLDFSRNPNTFTSIPLSNVPE